MIYENFWGSIVSFCNDVIDNRKVIYPGVDLEYMDFEAHANIQEMPTSDLIGSTAITFTEEAPEIFTMSFTIGVSTYADDESLFRMRNYVGEIFNRLRPGQHLPFYDHATAAQIGWLVITDGTMVMPMTRADVRPLQWIQCHGIIDPLTAAGL